MPAAAVTVDRLGFSVQDANGQLVPLTTDVGAFVYTDFDAGTTTIVEEACFDDFVCVSSGSELVGSAQPRYTTKAPQVEFVPCKQFKSCEANGEAAECLRFSEYDLVAYRDVLCTPVDGWTVWMAAEDTVMQGTKATLETFTTTTRVAEINGNGNNGLHSIQIR